MNVTKFLSTNRGGERRWPQNKTRVVHRYQATVGQSYRTDRLNLRTTRVTLTFDLSSWKWHATHRPLMCWPNFYLEMTHTDTHKEPEMQSFDVFFVASLLTNCAKNGGGGGMNWYFVTWGGGGGGGGVWIGILWHGGGGGALYTGLLWISLTKRQ